MPSPPDNPGSDSRAYHHGSLRQALLDATVRLVEEVGVDNVTVREVARRAGVSSGAPFRHFATKNELIVAVAQDGMAKLRETIEQRLGACRSTSPFAQLLALADAYVCWTVQHPTHYRVVGDRVLVDFYGSQALQRDNGWIRERMLVLLRDAETAGALRSSDVEALALQTRAMAYGVARMHVDNHLKEFGIAADQEQAAMLSVLRDFIISLARDPDLLRRQLDAAQGPD